MDKSPLTAFSPPVRGLLDRGGDVLHSSQKNFSHSTVLSHHCLWRFTSCTPTG